MELTLQIPDELVAHLGGEAVHTELERRAFKIAQCVRRIYDGRFWTGTAGFERAWILTCAVGDCRHQPYKLSNPNWAH